MPYEFDVEEFYANLSSASDPGSSAWRDFAVAEALLAVVVELQGISDKLGVIAEAVADDSSGVAVSANLTTGGMSMSTSSPNTGSISVDTANSSVTVGFEDDHGDVAAAPSGVTVTFESSDTTVLTVANDANNPLQGDLTPVKEGSVTISATISGANAPDGSAFTVSPETVNVVAGAAASAELSLEVPGQSS